LASFACLNFFTMPALLFLPYFANEAFKVGAPGLGALEAAVAGGMTAASLAWARAGKVERRFGVFFGAIAGTGLVYALMGAFPGFGAMLAGLVAAGALIGSLNVVVIAYFQEQVPGEQMGRFMGTLSAVCSGLLPISFGLYGALGQVVPPPSLLFVNGLAMGAIALALFAIPGLRRA
jgi:hypothetical protein